jgi:hypothetical protein
MPSDMAKISGDQKAQRYSAAAVVAKIPPDMSAICRLYRAFVSTQSSGFVISNLTGKTSMKPIAEGAS